MVKRHLDIVILSDLHLGTHHCHGNELLQYLTAIVPKTLILNGDVIDTWNLNKKYFPKTHMEILQVIMKMAVNGTKVYYITGNHDDVLRKFTNLSFGKIILRDKVVLQIKGEQYWIFHGDIFDTQRVVSPLLYFFGKKGYNFLLWINRMSNILRRKRSQPILSFSKKVKSSLKKAQTYISQFEKRAAALAEKQGYQYVICGHIHQPTIKTIVVKEKPITYMNAGDWVENLSALEYRYGEWSLYTYDELDYKLHNPKLATKKTISRDKGNSVRKILD